MQGQRRLALEGIRLGPSHRNIVRGRFGGAESVATMEPA